MNGIIQHRCKCIRWVRRVASKRCSLSFKIVIRDQCPCLVLHVCVCVFEVCYSVVLWLFGRLPFKCHWDNSAPVVSNKDCGTNVVKAHTSHTQTHIWLGLIVFMRALLKSDSWLLLDVFLFFSPPAHKQHNVQEEHVLTHLRSKFFMCESVVWHSIWTGIYVV